MELVGRYHIFFFLIVSLNHFNMNTIVQFQCESFQYESHKHVIQMDMNEFDMIGGVHSHRNRRCIQIENGQK